MADYLRDRRRLCRQACDRGHFHAQIRHAHPCLAQDRQQVPADHRPPQPEHGDPRLLADPRKAGHGTGVGRAVDDRVADLPRRPPGTGQCADRARRQGRQLAVVSKVTALLLAGSRPGGDPFAKRYGVDAKALIPILGEAMVLRPLRALLASKTVGAVRILTQEPDLIAPVLFDDDRWSIEPSSGTIAETLERICNDERTRWPLLVTTADHALLDEAMVDQFCAEGEGADLAL